MQTVVCPEFYEVKDDKIILHTEQAGDGTFVAPADGVLQNAGAAARSRRAVRPWPARPVRDGATPSQRRKSRWAPF